MAALKDLAKDSGRVRRPTSPLITRPQDVEWLLSSHHPLWLGRRTRPGGRSAQTLKRRGRVDSRKLDAGRENGYSHAHAVPLQNELGTVARLAANLESGRAAAALRL